VSGVSGPQPEEGFMAPGEKRLLLWELLIQEIVTNYRRNLLSPSSGKMREIEKAGSFDMTLTVYKTSRRHITEHNNLQKVKRSQEPN
jgi:hypothetical protein